MFGAWLRYFAWGGLMCFVGIGLVNKQLWFVLFLIPPYLVIHSADVEKDKVEARPSGTQSCPDPTDL